MYEIILKKKHKQAALYMLEGCNFSFVFQVNALSGDSQNNNVFFEIKFSALNQGPWKPMKIY